MMKTDTIGYTDITEKADLSSHTNTSGHIKISGQTEQTGREQVSGLTDQIGGEQVSGLTAARLADQIIEGRRLTREEAVILLTLPLDELCAGADKIRKAFCSDEADLCSIINGRSGRCGEDCKFCAQSACYQSEVEEYSFLSPEVIVEDMKLHKAQKVHRYSIVTAGRDLNGSEFELALEAYKEMDALAEGGIELCASLGLLNEASFRDLKEAGVSRYHANIETSRNYFPNICTTHTYEDKLEAIRRARAAGLSVCSGGIIGMGESYEDRIDMALSLYELDIPSIPLNILRPIKNTPFEQMPPLSEEEILRTVALFRYLNPKAQIRLAAGRNNLAHSGEQAFRSGANATITGDLLTTSGNNIKEDQEMLTSLGFRL